MDTQGRDGEENLASEQLLVGKWVEGGGGGGAVFRLQGGSAPNQWKVGQRRANIIKIDQECTPVCETEVCLMKLMSGKI